MDNRRIINREEYAAQPTAYVPPVQDYGYVDPAPVAPPPAPDAYSYNVQQRYVDGAGNAVERDEVVVDDPYTGRVNVLGRTAQLIYFVFGVIEVLILIRFALMLLGANLTEGFGAFIHNISQPFAAPFLTVLQSVNLNKAGTSVLEVGDILAVAIYALLAWGIVRLMWLVLGPTRSGRSVSTATRRSSYNV